MSHSDAPTPRPRRIGRLILASICAALATVLVLVLLGVREPAILGGIAGATAGSAVALASNRQRCRDRQRAAPTRTTGDHGD